MRVTIVDNSKGERCAAGCGTDWSSAEAITQASQQIKERLGEMIELEYLDLSKPVNDNRASGLTGEIEDKNLSLPLLVIDGVPRISGQFDIRQLMDVIEATVEISNKR